VCAGYASLTFNQAHRGFDPRPGLARINVDASAVEKPGGL
jgi:hypothetical protein